MMASDELGGDVGYHMPVLLEASLDHLVTDPDGVYLDVTFGGGGHSKAILKRITAKGRLFGIDQDVDAIANRVSDDRLTLVRTNFEYISHFMGYYEVSQLDGVLADLGVSSFHFDSAERGFSFRFDADLDMRMNQSALMSAREVLATYEAGDLQQLFSRYGEVRNARTLARAIVDARSSAPIVTTADFDAVLGRCVKGERQRYFAQVYQALRIEVNREMEVLQSMLEQGRDLLAPGGRFVVISYHSLEDRLVKQFFRDNNFSGQRLEDDFGRSLVNLVPISGKPIVPDEGEIRRNSRAASAKMRVAIKK